MAPIIQTEKLCHIYSPGTPFAQAALREVDFSAEAGECIAIIGHTGSGKSTLVQHLNGLMKPSSGRVLFEGQDIWEKPREIRSVRFRVGLVFQYPEYQLFEETVRADIAFGPRNMGLSEAEIQSRVESAAVFSGVDPTLMEQSPFTLSGGQRRRVAIAGVLAMEPSVLILDEPTAGLDPRSRDEILKNITDFRRAKGSTVLLVTHSMEEAARMADRIVIMQEGMVAACGNPESVFSDTELLNRTGMDVPQITQVFRNLAAMGLPVSPGIHTVESAKAEILRLRRDLHA